MSRTGTVEMFYDAGCGPCTFLARVSRGFGHGRIEILPLAGPEADTLLGDLPSSERFGYFHLVAGARRLSGGEAVPALIGLVAGRTAERAVRRVGVFRRGVDRVYQAFWSYRRTRGCAASGVSSG